MPKVLIQPATYDTADRAIDRIFEFFPLKITGKKVLIKPNVLRAAAPSEGITTHPSILRATVRKVVSMKPASLTVGDNPGLLSYGANEEAFTTCGLMDAACGYYLNIGNDSEKIAFNPEFMPAVSISKAVMDADIIISLPKFKTHGLTIITGCIKNSYGFLPGAQKAKLHKAAGNSARFQEMLVELFRIKIPDLFIMDAVVGMEGNGPASPDLRDIGLIMASDNAVSLDSVTAHMMGCYPERLRFLTRAKEMGLGDYDLSKTEIAGEIRHIPDFKLPPMGGEAVLHNTTMQDMIQSRIVMRPKANPELCTGCGTCIDQCPMDALSMNDDSVPIVQAELCIACYCCQEMCPVKAISLG